MYINKVVSGSLETINAKRPYSAYNVPLTRRDPGPDAVLGNGDDAGRVTIYDYSAAYQGGAFVSNKRVNADNTVTLLNRGEMNEVLVFTRRR